MKHGNKNPIAAACVLMLLSCSASAQGMDAQYSEFLKSISDTMGKSLTESVNNLVFAFMVNNKVTELAQNAEKDIPDYMVKSPPLQDKYIKGVIDTFVTILEPFYVAAVAAVGIYLIFMSQSPRGRAQAKAFLLSLMVGIMLTPITTDIMSLLLEASKYLASEILAVPALEGDYAAMLKPAVTYFQSYTTRLMAINVAASMPFMLLALFFSLGVYVVLIVRYFFIILLAMLFPAAVFFLFFYHTRKIGVFFFRQLFFWVFMPAGYAASFVVVALSRSAIVSMSPGFSGFFDVAGALFIILSPLTLFFLMNWMSAVVVPASLVMTPIGSPVKARSRMRSAAEDGGGERRYEKGATEVRAALGLRGLQRAAQEEDSSAGTMRSGGEVERIAHERQGYGPSISRPASSFQAGGSYVRDLQAVRDLQSMPQSMPGVQSGGERFSFAAPSKALTPAGTGQSRNPKTGKGTLVVTIPSTRTPSIALEIPRGETETIDVSVINKSDGPIYKVMVSDEDLTAAGIQVSYSRNSFSLKNEEERIIAVSFTPAQDSSDGVHNGGIIFQTGGGSASGIEVALRVIPADRKASGSMRVGGEPKDGAFGGKQRAPMTWQANYHNENDLLESPPGNGGTVSPGKTSGARQAQPAEREKGMFKGRRVIDVDHADSFDEHKEKGETGAFAVPSPALKAPRKFVEKAVIETVRTTTVDADTLKLARPIHSLPRVPLNALFIYFKKKK